MGMGFGPPRAPAGCRQMCPLYAQSHLTGHRSPCPRGRPADGIGRQEEEGSRRVSWVEKPRREWGHHVQLYPKLCSTF